MKTPLFYDDVKGYMKWLYNNHLKTYHFVASQMWLETESVDSGGSCTSGNCHGATGCTHSTTNGYCTCQGPDGPCVWVPLV